MVEKAIGGWKQTCSNELAQKFEAAVKKVVTVPLRFDYESNGRVLVSVLGDQSVDSIIDAADTLKAMFLRF